MRIAIIGTGYVGLVTGTCFAEVGHLVTCLDSDQAKIKTLQEGKMPLFEPGLEELVERNVAEERLCFTTSHLEAVGEAQIIFLCLPTPSNRDGSCDLRYLQCALREIAPFLSIEALIVSKSTAPVGTARQLTQWLSESLQEAHRTFHHLPILVNPEFLKQGDAVHDCLKPSRIIIGHQNQEAAELLRQLYAPFTLNHDRILLMDWASAEMTKYGANAMLASRISFMNELSHLCEKMGADITQVRLAMGMDPRIGYDFLYPGLGYGGSCFPKDLEALKAMAKEAHVSSLLLEAIQEVNRKQKRYLAEKIRTYYHSRGGLKGRSLGLLGLSFKPDTDDLRGAPSLSLINQLSEWGIHLRLYDPVALPNAKRLLANHPHSSLLHFAHSIEDCAEGVDGLLLITEWKSFRQLHFEKLKHKMKGWAFFDGRNQYRPSEMVAKGFDYISIGRPDSLTSSSSTAEEPCEEEDLNALSCRSLSLS